MGVIYHVVYIPKEKYFANCKSFRNFAVSKQKEQNSSSEQEIYAAPRGNKNFP